MAQPAPSPTSFAGAFERPRFGQPGYDMAADLAALDAQLKAANGGNWLIGIGPGTGPDVGGLVGIARSYGWKPEDE